MISIAFWVFVLMLIYRWLTRVPRTYYPPQRASIHPKLRRAVMDRNRGPAGTYSYTYCGCWSHSRTIGPDGMPWTLDHIFPWSKGGPDTYDNLTLACWTCNQAKGARVL